MAVYRFKVVFEDQEDTVREIEIQGKQSFEEFHRTIQEAIGFDNSKDASFFMSDDFWRKGQEITNRKMVIDDDDDDDYRRPKKVPAKQMSKSRVADFIDDPHQKIVYVFDPAAKWTLLVELLKIQSDDAKVNYPRTVKSSGAAPKQYKQVIAPPVDDEDEEDEEDKKAREKAKTFKMEEDYDEGAGDGAETEGEEEDVPAEDAVEAEGGEEEDAADAEERGDFGSQEGEDY